jgi:hypothetical protein
MDPIGYNRYISTMRSVASKVPEIDSLSLNILIHFAWEKSLSAYQLCAKLKSTDSEMPIKT